MATISPVTSAVSGVSGAGAFDRCRGSILVLGRRPELRTPDSPVDSQLVAGAGCWVLGARACVCVRSSAARILMHNWLVPHSHSYFASGTDADSQCSRGWRIRWARGWGPRRASRRTRRSPRLLISRKETRPRRKRRRGMHLSLLHLFAYLNYLLLARIRVYAYAHIRVGAAACVIVSTRGRNGDRFALG